MHRSTDWSTKGKEYFEFFANAIFKDGQRPAGTDWVIEEFRKLPPWLSAAIYSDYIATDFTNVLPTITVPTLVVNADGPVLPGESSRALT